jgi:hypothetical protein
MRKHSFLMSVAAAGCALTATSSAAKAAEFALGTYGLGSSSFGAGVTPPTGTYVTTAAGFYHADISGPVTIGNVRLNAGAKVDFFTTAVNGLYVPERKVLGGNLGLGVTVPVGHIGIEADIAVGPVSASRQVDGWGLGDIVPRAQLGWQAGDLAYTVWLQTVTPTGRYSPTFSASTGLNRLGIDTGLAVTWTHKPSRLQFNGAAGFTFNFENQATDYRTGNEFHFEWAIGYELSKGLIIGVVGYDYRQMNGDSGPGAILGPFKSRVDAVGPGLSYSTMIDKMPLVFSLNHYREFNAEHRFEGNQTLGSMTLRF